jgi:glycosyltransferase involved in cell wall biosynthesis
LTAKPLRIGIDTRMAHYRREGGIAQYTLRLLDALLCVDAGHRFVVLHHWHDQLSHIVTSPVGSQVSARRLYTPSHHRFEQVALPLELAFAELDVLHSPDFIPPFIRRCASVITVHDLAFRLHNQLLTRESAAYYGQIDHAVRSADRIIAVSEATRQDMLRLLPVDPAKVTVIHEAADPVYRPMSDPASVAPVLERYRLEKAFVLYVGTIEPRKNLPLLLHAFRRVRDGGDQTVQLAIAGRKGWLADDVYALCERLGLNAYVKFLGPLPAQELAALYNAAEAFVMPSLYEGFGLPVVEAMACGAPVLVSSVSSLPEVAGDAGLCLDPHDADAWAAALARVLGDSTLRASLRRKSLKRATAFSWERAARETLAVYQQAAKAK